MGLGGYRAGVGPAGHSPVVSTKVAADVLAVAIRYEGKDSDWAIGTDARYRKVHPVDQGFALAMCVDQGSIKASPATGNTIRQIKNLGAKNLSVQIDEAVRAANPIARYVADGSATILRISYAVEPHGRLLVACAYRNNILGTEDRAVYET